MIEPWMVATLFGTMFAGMCGFAVSSLFSSNRVFNVLCVVSFGLVWLSLLALMLLSFYNVLLHRA